VSANFALTDLCSWVLPTNFIIISQITRALQMQKEVIIFLHAQKHTTAGIR
jgi:hypothetical protein